MTTLYYIKPANSLKPVLVATDKTMLYTDAALRGGVYVLYNFLTGVREGMGSRVAVEGAAASLGYGWQALRVFMTRPQPEALDDTIADLKVRYRHATTLQEKRNLKAQLCGAFERKYDGTAWRMKMHTIRVRLTDNTPLAARDADPFRRWYEDYI